MSHKRFGFPNCTVQLKGNKVFLMYANSNTHEEYTFNTPKEAEKEYERLTKVYKR